MVVHKHLMEGKHLVLNIFLPGICSLEILSYGFIFYSENFNFYEATYISQNTFITLDEKYKNKQKNKLNE